MDLWTPIVEADKLHPNFKALCESIRTAEREVLLRWADGFPDRDGKFVQEFQTTFNSSFWELYLHAVFKEYAFKLEWTHPAPDFALSSSDGAFNVEATTANAAVGKTKEWEKDFEHFMGKSIGNEFWELNKEAMIRLSNALHGKLKAYREKYCKHDHVRGKPFVVAIAPFEQPFFQHQYDRPIRAVLYDHYVDEDAHRKNPEKFPNGPPTVNLGFIEKDNGSSVSLGIFASEEWCEVSAVIFSCSATMGKVDMLSSDSPLQAKAWSIWGGKPDGAPQKRMGTREECNESLVDGLQVYHNPYARVPLNPSVFRRSGVVQHYVNSDGEWVYEEIDNCLQIRSLVLLSQNPSDRPVPPRCPQ